MLHKILHFRYFAILTLLFLLALSTRVEAFFDTKDTPGRQPLAFSITGSGADQDYQLKCSSLVARGLTSEFMTHYDYLFMCPMMGVVFRYFNYIDGLSIITTIVILSGCFVSVTPYLLFSSRKHVSVGGVLGSLLLIFNSVMIDGSSGRFFIYPLVSFMYVIFIFTLVKALKNKSYFWTTTFGIIAALQSLNKPFLFVNDIPFLFVFFFLLTVDSISLQKTFPFVQIKWNMKHIAKGLISILVYFFITISYEIIHGKITGGFSFLTDLFLNTGGPSTKDAVLGASLHFKGPLDQKMRNLFGLGFLATHLLTKYVLTSLIPFLASILLILGQKKVVSKVLLSIITMIIVFFILLAMKPFLENNIYVPIDILRRRDFISISFFCIFIFAVAFSKKQGFALVSSQIFYFGALAMTLAAVNQPQLFVTLIVWVAILVAYALHEGIRSFLSRFSSKFQCIAISILLVIFMISTSAKLLTMPSRFFELRNEVRYLKWVKTVIPEDAYILSNSSDNLILVSNITNRRILTNAFYVATKVEPGNKIWENTEFPSFPLFVKAEMEKKSPGPTFYILDHDVPTWTRYLDKGVTETYPPGKYQLQQVTESKYLGRKIYSLSLNPNYISPVEPKVQTKSIKK